MSQEKAILITLVAYKLVLLGIGFFASHKTKDGTDFFLGGRGLGPVVAALSASASSSSVWTLLGVSGAAYSWGLSAIWLFPACLGGFLINWSLLAPGLRRLSEREGSLTVSEVLAGPKGTPLRLTISRTASAIILFSLATYVATQFQGAGKTFSEVFQINQTQAIFIGAGIVVVYTMMGGFWAVSLTDSLQGFLMMLTSVALPVAALIRVGGPIQLWQKLEAIDGDSLLRLSQGDNPALCVGFVLGLLGIGLGYPGQPHVVNRFMALRDEKALKTGRRIALVWGALVYLGMLIVGWCGRAMKLAVDDKEVVFLASTTELFPPVIAGVMIAAVVSAIMSTADSQLLVLVSSLTHDLNPDADNDEGLLARSRVVIVVVSLVAVWAALYGPKEIFTFVLSAWSAMGAAFGPLLLVTVLRGRVSPTHSLLAMHSGFCLSLATSIIPGFSHGLWQRVFPWVVALIIAMIGSKPEKQKDR